MVRPATHRSRRRSARLVEPVTDARLTDWRRSFRVLFENGVNEASLVAGDLVVLGHLEQDALLILDEEFARHAPELLLTGTDATSVAQVDLVLGRTQGIIDPRDPDAPPVRANGTAVTLRRIIRVRHPDTQFWWRNSDDSASNANFVHCHRFAVVYFGG